MAALSVLQNNQKQAEQSKQDKIAAAQGQAPAPKQPGQDQSGIMGMLKSFKAPQNTQLTSNGLSKGTNSLLDSEGFDGKDSEPDADKDDLLSDY